MLLRKSRGKYIYSTLPFTKKYPRGPMPFKPMSFMGQRYIVFCLQTEFELFDTNIVVLNGREH